MNKIINWHAARSKKGLDPAFFHPGSGVSMRRANLQVQNGRLMKPEKKKLFLRNGSEIYFDGANEVLFEGIPNLPFDDLDIKDKDKLIDSFFPEISDQTVEFLLTDNEKED